MENIPPLKGPLLCRATGWKALAHLTPPLLSTRPYSTGSHYPSYSFEPYLPYSTTLESGPRRAKRSGRQQEVGPAFLPSDRTARPCHQGAAPFVYFTIIIYGCPRWGTSFTHRNLCCGPPLPERFQRWVKTNLNTFLEYNT